MRPALAITGLFLAVVAIGACGDDGGGDGDGIFDEEGVPFTFEYPDDFAETDDVTIDQELGGAADESYAIVDAENDGIFVQRFTLNLPVDQSNLTQAKREFDALIGQIDPETSSRSGKRAGLPALEFDRVDVPSIEGAESRIVVLFQGDQEYMINCQSTPAARQQVEEACEQALGTLELK